MLTLLRALTYAALFIGFFLVALPARLLRWAGIARPEHAGPAQVAGVALVVLGGALAIWCVVTFARVGRGTPAPFDPPRRLVVSGPYRWVRNPMYWGALLALAGAAVYYGSVALAGYAALFAAAVLALVLGYEEPTLRATFGAEYEAYCGNVPRWWPHRGE